MTTYPILKNIYQKQYGENITPLSSETSKCKYSQNLL